MPSNIPSIQSIIDELTTLQTEIGNSTTVEELNDIKDRQLEMYNLIKEINDNLYATYTSSETLNEHQETLATSLGAYNQQLEADIGHIAEQKDHKVRLSKINKFYSDKYLAHTKLVKVIITCLIPIILLAILKSKGILPDDAFNILILVVLVIGGVIFLKKYKDVISRDNQNYQEYAWKFNADMAPANADDSE